MSLFNTILAGIQDKIFKENISKESIVHVLEEVLHTGFTTDQIKVKDSVLIISAAPTIKMAIKLKEQILLQALKSQDIFITSIQ
jgi:hypothetical protein